LKDKRQVVRSVAQRIRNRFEVSVAEVADNDAWQRATLGVAVVANDARHCDEVLREIVGYVESSRLDAELLDVESEVIAFG
jgi:uncharacterized protein YlxP (DUF503 family)